MTNEENKKSSWTYFRLNLHNSYNVESLTSFRNNEKSEARQAILRFRSNIYESVADPGVGDVPAVEIHLSEN